jgi:hypothetical protein
LMNVSDSVLLCVPARDSVVHHFLIHAIEMGTHNVSAFATIDDNYPGDCGPEILPSARYSLICVQDLRDIFELLGRFRQLYYCHLPR